MSLKKTSRGQILPPKPEDRGVTSNSIVVLKPGHKRPLIPVRMGKDGCGY